MLNNFIFAKQKSLFISELEKGNILNEAIVFIEDTKEIWNHGTYFDGNAVDLSDVEKSIQDILDNIPTKTSDLLNDNGFISSPIIPEQEGIYAVTADKRLISLDEADETCIALALIKGPHKFWIDKYEHYSDETEIYLWDSTFKDTGVPNYTALGGGSTKSYGYLNPDGSGLNLDYTTWEEGTALGDIKGFENSEVLKTRDSDYRNIGYVLNKFNAGEVGDNLGHNDWYIPACGQAALFCLHRDELNVALKKIGGTELTKTSYWTSSEYAQRDAWYINLWDYSVGMYSANKTKYTEFKLRLIRDIRTLDERFDDKQNTISDLSSIREGSALGATAVQPEAISDMETKTNAAATYLPIGDYALTSDITEIKTQLGDINTILESIIGNTLFPITLNQLEIDTQLVIDLFNYVDKNQVDGTYTFKSGETVTFYVFALNKNYSIAYLQKISNNLYFNYEYLSEGIVLGIGSSGSIIIDYND